MKKRRILLRFAALLLLFCLGLLLLSGILIRKDLDKPFDMTTKLAGFFNEPADEFDLLFFGTSHMYTSVAPPLLWEETGLKSYVLASQSQPIWATYYYIREALRSQTPKCVVLELHMFCQQMYYDEGAVHSAIDHFPFGRNKIEMAVKLYLQSDLSGDDAADAVYHLARPLGDADHGGSDLPPLGAAGPAEGLCSAGGDQAAVRGPDPEPGDRGCSGGKRAGPARDHPPLPGDGRAALAY